MVNEAPTNGTRRTIGMRSENADGVPQNLDHRFFVTTMIGDRTTGCFVTMPAVKPARVIASKNVFLKREIGLARDKQKSRRCLAAMRPALDPYGSREPVAGYLTLCGLVDCLG
jgi:hypothetical protein